MSGARTLGPTLQWLTRALPNIPPATVSQMKGVLEIPVLLGSLVGANMNSTADQAIVLALPTPFTKFQLNRITVINPSTSLTTAVGGIYTATSKGGLAMGNAAQAYSGLTTAGPNASGSLINMGIATSWYVPASFATPDTVYLSLTTPQGSAATADFYLYGFLIP